METIKAQKFELTALIDELSDEEQVKQMMEDIRNLAGRYLRFAPSDKGVQRLSYPIRNHGTEHEAAHRLEFTIVIPAENAQELYKSMQELGRDERVMRYLLVRVGK